MFPYYWNKCKIILGKRGWFVIWSADCTHCTVDVSARSSSLLYRLCGYEHRALLCSTDCVVMSTELFSALQTVWL